MKLRSGQRVRLRSNTWFETNTTKMEMTNAYSGCYIYDNIHKTYYNKHALLFREYYVFKEHDYLIIRSVSNYDDTVSLESPTHFFLGRIWKGFVEIDK